MGKKKIKKPNKHVGSTLLDRLPKNEGEHIELMIKFTLRNVSNPPLTQFDKDMLAQAERLRERLTQWRKNENQNKTTTS